MNIRNKLTQTFATDADFNAFIIDHFPQVHRRYTSGMDRVERVNLLLQLIEPISVEKSLRKYMNESSKNSHSRLFGSKMFICLTGTACALIIIFVGKMYFDKKNNMNVSDTQGGRAHLSQASSISSLLSKDEVILSFANINNRLQMLFIDQQGVIEYFLPVSPLKFEKYVELYNRYVIANELESKQYGQELSDILFPIEIRKALNESKIKYVGIVDAIQLKKLPVEMLPYANAYFMDQYYIFHETSLTETRRILTRVDDVAHNEAIVGIGGFRYDARTVQEELKILDRHFPNEPRMTILEKGSSEANLVSALGQAKILHVATHGVFIERERPLGIRLSEDGERSLDADEIRHLDLRGTSLVTLSACNSGLSSLDTGLGTVEGMGQAFLDAGVRATVSTRWRVREGVAKEVWNEFYKNVQSLGPCEALGESLRSLKRRKLSDRLFELGAFYCSGNWRPEPKLRRNITAQ